MRHSMFLHKALVAAVFVLAGFAFAYPCSDGKQDSHPPAADVTGTWDVYYYGETVSKDSLVLRQTGKSLAGSWYGGSDGKTFPIDGTIDGANVKVNVHVSPSTMHMSIDAKLAGDALSMKGSWIVSGTGSLDGIHPWRAVKHQATISREGTED